MNNGWIPFNCFGLRGQFHQICSTQAAISDMSSFLEIFFQTTKQTPWLGNITRPLSCSAILTNASAIQNISETHDTATVWDQDLSSADKSLLWHGPLVLCVMAHCHTDPLMLLITPVFYLTQLQLSDFIYKIYDYFFFLKHDALLLINYKGQYNTYLIYSTLTAAYTLMHQ